MSDPYAEVKRLGAELSNWGRWGPDDEIGTLNLIDAAAVRRGAQCVRVGRSHSLALPLGPTGPHTNQIPGRFNPHHYMTAICQPVPSSPFFRFSDDVVTMPLNAATQWDSLAHVCYDDRIWNGFGADTVTEDGASKAGADAQARVGLATRAIVLDVARHRGVDRLDAGQAIQADELNAVLSTTGLRAEPGDVVLVRTGFMQVLTVDGDRERFNGSSPGVGMSVLRWLRERDVAAVASDTVTVEVTPSEDGKTVCPLHLVAIRDMGLLLGEMFDLERLASNCAELNRWDVQLVAPPLPFTGGISSPINPVATL